MVHFLTGANSHGQGRVYHSIRIWARTPWQSQEWI